MVTVACKQGSAVGTSDPEFEVHGQSAAGKFTPHSARPPVVDPGQGKSLDGSASPSSDLRISTVGQFSELQVETITSFLVMYSSEGGYMK